MGGGRSVGTVSSQAKTMEFKVKNLVIQLDI
jgi:hypothetical protein